MSNKKNDNQTLAKIEIETAPLPFFAHLLSNQGDVSMEGGPTDYCSDNICWTKKYPSDDDEPTSSRYDR